MLAYHICIPSTEDELFKVFSYVTACSPSTCEYAPSYLVDLVPYGDPLGTAQVMWVPTRLPVSCLWLFTVGDKVTLCGPGI